MGVKGLLSLIRKYAPDLIYNYDRYFPIIKHLYIDAYVYLYRWYFIGIRNEIKYKNKYVHHLRCILFLSAKLKKNGIKFTFVFDGKPPSIKAHTIEQRKNNNKLPKTVILESIELLRLIGIPYVMANGEADKYIAHMRYGASYDSDLIPFGIEIMIIGNSSINVNLILKRLDITKSMLIDICILAGTDYNNDNLHSIDKAYELIKKYKKIENLPQNIPISTNWKLVRLEYKSTPNVPLYINKGKIYNKENNKKVMDLCGNDNKIKNAIYTMYSTY